MEAERQKHTHRKPTLTHSPTRTFTHIHTHTRCKSLGEMECDLLAVQLILIQSGGKAEQRVNTAHIHTPRTGDTHTDTPPAHTLRKHSPLTPVSKVG